MTRTTITESYVLVETDDIDFDLLKEAVKVYKDLVNNEAEMPINTNDKD